MYIDGLSVIAQAFISKNNQDILDDLIGKPVNWIQDCLSETRQEITFIRPYEQLEDGEDLMRFILDYYSVKIGKAINEAYQETHLHSNAIKEIAILIREEMLDE